MCHALPVSILLSLLVSFVESTLLFSLFCTLTLTLCSFAGWYYIAVYGFSNCTFNIVATFSAVIRLTDGQSQAGSVATEESRWYTYFVNNANGECVFVLCVCGCLCVVICCSRLHVRFDAFIVVVCRSLSR